MRYLIGIDIGTSATKAIMMDENGTKVASSACEYPLYQPHNGWAEQNPADWKAAALNALKKVVSTSGVSGEDVAGIGLSGQMHGLVLLDEEGEPLRSSIIWCDQRTSKQVAEMEQIMPISQWLEITANPPLAAWTAAKILWVREHEPELYQQCRKILLPKDYIRYILTGAFVTDVSDASGMQLLDVKNRRWSKEVLQKLDIEENLLCQVMESQEISGFLREDIALQCGLKAGIPVAAGASDNAAAAIGTGVVKEGEAFTTVGTSAIVYTHLDHYAQIPEGSLHVCCCAVPGGYHTMGGPQAAGLSLEWFKDKFCQDFSVRAGQEQRSIYELINEAVAEVPIGSDRLIYMPFLMGERTPHMNPDCRGAFIGLNTIHEKPHLLRAIMEGVAYSLADCNEILKRVGVPLRSMRACGGGVKSPVWRKIMANLYRCDIRTMKQEEGPAFGAAILAGVASGVYPDLIQTCDRLIEENQITRFEETQAQVYEAYFQLYLQIYEHLKADFSVLASL